MKNSFILIQDFLENFESYSQTKQSKISLYLLNLCKIELETLNIDVDKKIFLFEPLIFTKDFISEYFTTKLENLSVFKNDSLFKEYLSIFSETVSFFDQLEFENLLNDTEDDRKNLLEKIYTLENNLK